MSEIKMGCDNVVRLGKGFYHVNPNTNASSWDGQKYVCADDFVDGEQVGRSIAAVGRARWSICGVLGKVAIIQLRRRIFQENQLLQTQTSSLNYYNHQPQRQILGQAEVRLCKQICRRGAGWQINSYCRQSRKANMLCLG